MRFIIDKARDAYTNMALDEAMLKLRVEGIIDDTLRVYQWAPSAVSIGYFQRIRDVVNITECLKNGIDIVRRQTGGGAVLHMYNGEVTYSFVTLPGTVVPRSIKESFRVICQAIVKSLRIIGADAEFKPVNDVIIGGRKVSGNAQTRKYGGFLQHGTILTRLDTELMSRVLIVPGEKFRDKSVTTIEERVTSLERELGREVDFMEVVKALKQGFEEVLNVKLKESSFTEEELRTAYQLRHKYLDPSWTYMR